MRPRVFVAIPDLALAQPVRGDDECSGRKEIRGIRTRECSTSLAWAGRAAPCSNACSARCLGRSTPGGELNAIFPRVSTQDQRCGCGEPFSRLPLLDRGGRACFQRVAVGGRPNGAPSAACHSTASPTQPDDGLARAAYLRELKEYLDTYHRLYEAISAEAHAEVVVDASKSAAQLCALRRGFRIWTSGCSTWCATRAVSPTPQTSGHPQAAVHRRRHDGYVLPPAARRALVCAAARVQHARDGSPACSPNAIRGSRLSPSPHARAGPEQTRHDTCDGRPRSCRRAQRCPRQQPRGCGE